MDQIVLLRNGTCFEQGTYEELLKKDVNFASLVGKNFNLEDPCIDELVNEIDFFKLTLPTPEPRPASRSMDLPIEEDLGDIASSPKTGGITFATIKKPLRPVANTISFPLTSMVNASNNENTISRLQQLNSQSVQRSNINERTVSQWVEQRQLSIIDGQIPASNFTVNQATGLARAIERNQLTVHSLHGGFDDYYDDDEEDQDNDEVFEDDPTEMDEQPLGDVEGDDSPAITRLEAVDANKLSQQQPTQGGNKNGTRRRRRRKRMPFSKLYLVYLSRATGLWLTMAIIVLFFIVYAIRIFADFWLQRYVDDVFLHPSQHLDYMVIYAIITAVFLLGLMVRGYLFVWAVIEKCQSFHRKIMIVSFTLACRY